MVLWHSGDGWLRSDLHSGEAFFFLRFVGGLAAPSFLMLAGLGVGLGGRPAKDTQDAARRLRANAARGAEIVLLGYALRLQTWLIDAAAIAQLHTLRAWLPLLIGYVALFAACRATARAARYAPWLWLGGACLAALGLAQVNAVAPGRLERLRQVDVLQAIGASLVLLALGERWLRWLQRPAALLVTGLAVAWVTYPLGQTLPGALPVPLAAYLARFPGAPGEAVAAALFPLCPWFAYACFGAALGSCLRRRGQEAERLLLAAVVLGAALAACTSEAHAPIQRLIANPLLVPPLRVAFRVGVVLVLLGFGFAFSPGRSADRVVAFGRASLRVYWFHLPFAYGILARPVHGKLDLGTWAALATLLLTGMWGLTRIGRRHPPEPDRA